MRAVLPTAFLVAVRGSLPGERDLTGYTFEAYVEEFGKNYANGVEQATRQAIFEENVKEIKRHNALDGKSWWATVNDFTDLTNDEFRAMTKGRKDSPIDLSAVFEHESNVDLPDKLDWREKDGIVTPVKNQGSCGSCWAFSATETFESHLAIATGQSAQKLSAQQITSCTKNPKHCGGSGGCDGATQPLAFEYTKTAGMTTEANWRYTARTGTCTESKIKNPTKPNSGYVKVTVNNYTDHMVAVATKGPIAISLDAGGFLTFQAYGGGVVNCRNHWDMDHAVQLVGYGTDGGKDYWLVRNSWGASWGERGYTRLQRFGEGKEPCGVDKTPQDGEACAGDTKPRTYCGSCGMLGSSSYPTFDKDVVV